jgi:serine/threonine-protein kinase
MEYVEGESLQGRLRALHRAGRRLPQAEALELLASIAEAVGFAHKQGLVHRDLKPANVMLNPAGEPILMDFGVVKIIGSQQAQTATGVVVGTPMYIAPELIRGHKPDPRSDIYSLGIMLFEMLAGHPPFEADSAMALMIKHVNEPVPDIRAIQPDVSPALARVVDKALAKDPDDRFQSAGEFAAALRGGLPTVEARPPAPTAARAPSGLAAAPVAPALAPAGTPPWRRTPVLLGCGALLALGLLFSAAAAAFAVNAAVSQGRATPTASASLTQAATTPAPTETQATATERATFTATASPTRTRPAPSPTTFTPATLAASPTTFVPPTHTPPPPTQPATPTATASPPANDYMAQITHIDIVDGRYAVSFTTLGYVAMLPGQHVHFFFDTVPPEQAGSPASGPWIVHAAEPNPFTGYRVADRPSAATQMCILVANPDHSVIANSGNCWALPQ